MKTRIISCAGFKKKDGTEFGITQAPPRFFTFFEKQKGRSLLKESCAGRVAEAITSGAGGGDGGALRRL